MKKLIITNVLAALFAAGELYSQVTDATFDATWAANMQAAINDVVASGAVKGTSVALLTPDQGVFIGVGGESTDGVPITSDMQFGVGSHSKTFTVALIMKLQELGVLSLSDKISDWLPPFPNVNPDITIRQLLTHQSGIFDFEQELYPNEEFFRAMDPFVYGPEIFYQPEDVLAMIGPPHFPPGEKYSYSNTNHLIAAMIIEAATGTSFVQNMHQYILDPLNLTKTFVAAYESPNGTVANGWHMGDDIGNVPTLAPHSMYIGSGSIFSTANDMVHWMQSLFNGEVVSQASLNEMADIERASAYGMGLSVVYWPAFPDDDVWTHGGWVPGYTSDMGHDVKRNSSLFVTSNDENDYSVLIPILIQYYENYPRYVNDASILKISSPISEACDQQVNPEVILKNYGSAALTSVTISYRVDAGAIHTYNWTGNLLTDESVSVSLPGINATPGYHKFESYTSNPNGLAEGYTSFNDLAKSNFNVNTSAATTLFEDFEGAQFPPVGWVSGGNRNHDWGRCELSLLSGNGCAIKANAFDGTQRTYDLEMPLLNLTTLNKPELSFMYAYGYAGHGTADDFEILVSDDCGETYQTVFQKSGPSLKTSDSPGLFIPDDNQWAQLKINLSSHKKSEVLIKFRSTTAWGNNIYIDNVRIAEKQGNSRVAGEASLDVTVFPNPVSGKATISLTLDKAEKVFVGVYDMTGKFISTIGEEEMGEGINLIEWNSENIQPGIYFLKLESENFTRIERVSVVQ